jgi:L-amino acid N-acyltransferase YncA
MQPADDLSFYDEYASLYAAMHRERPALASEVPVEPFDKMRVYLEQKTLFHVIIDGERAGVMAALVDRFAGMHGYRILEKFLYPAWRGRGFAPAAQRHFAEALPDTTGEVLYGFIHPDNIWSSRAARHDGREDIGGYFYLRLA